jgi:hypothetical protein
MQQNGEADGFLSIATSPVTSPSLVLIVHSRNATASSRVVKLPSE